MPANVVTRLRQSQPGVVCLDALYGGHGGIDGCHDVPFSLHSRQSSFTASSRPSSAEMASSPASTETGPATSGSRIGRPPQWTISRSRKLARLYLYSTLSIDKIIKVLEDDGFNPRKNSAQKTIHKMLDNDPRYLRPESRIEMSKRINSLSISLARRRNRRGISGRRTATARGSTERRSVPPSSEVTTPSGQSIKTEDAPAFDFSASPDVSSIGYFSTPFRNVEHEGNAQRPFDTTYVHEIKRRVSDCSTHYALQLCSLIQEYTISMSSDDDGRSSGRRPSAALSEGLEPALPEFETSSEAYEAFPDPGFALPGDFLTAHTRSCADFPGQQHGKGNCWCSIAKDTSADQNSWLLSTGEPSPRARHVLEHPLSENLSLVDSFGNTPLHLFAALGGYQETLCGMVARASNGSLRAVNTGGQTFLHVLNLEWFVDFSGPSTPLKRLLGHIRASCPEILFETDVYGRTFFHRAHSVVRDPPALASLISLFNPALASRRDAFGFNPVPDPDVTSQSPYIPPRRTNSPSPLGEDTVRSSPGSRPPSSASEGSFLAYHARLVRVIQSSYTNPLIEDAEGRNGLHCLAEAILNQQTMDRHVRSSSSSSSSPASTSRPLKRKLDSKPPSPAPGNPTAITTVTTTSSSSTKTSNPEDTLPTRLRHLHSLLHPSVSLSLAHYDKRGYTPLMAFIEHIPDDQDDKAKTLQAILETLVRAGGGGGKSSTEARNRRGETALLMAARLGRKVALATLLEMGASVAARDVHGRGVLEVLDGEVRGGKARGDVSLYARLEACRVLVTGRREWGVEYVKKGDGAVVGEAPVVREWRVRQGGR